MKETFSAEYLGSSIPEESWNGSVHSTYSRAVNLLHPSGVLMSIVDSIESMSDYGITVKNFNSFVSMIKTGGKFLWEGNRIVLPEMIIDMNRASVWSGSILPGYKDSLIDAAPFKAAFAELAMEEGLSPVVTKRGENLYSNAAGRILDASVKTADVFKGLLIDLSPLVGMGIGFTPSGDDFITGVMLYEAISGMAFVDRGSIGERLGRTTAGGRTLLSLAIKGSFPFYLKQFAGSLITGGRLPSEIVKKALQHGSTSGSDALTGFFWISELF